MWEDRLSADGQVLDLRSVRLTTLCDAEFPEDVKVLHLGNTGLLDLQGVKWPSGLLKLYLSHTELTSLDGVELPAGLQRLSLNGTHLTSLEGVELPSGLQELDLKGTKLTSLHGVKLPESLKEIDLSFTKVSNIDGVKVPDSLQVLDLRYTQVTSLSGVELPAGLQVLEVGDMYSAPKPKQLSVVILGLTSLEGVELPAGLKTLVLRGMSITNLCGVKLPLSLRNLDLRSTNLMDLYGVELPFKLQKIYLNKTNVTRLPEQIEKLTDLKVLNLSGLKLDELPYWLPKLGLPFTREKNEDGICLHETTVKGVDMSIFDQSQETILQWFKEYSINKRQYIFIGGLGGMGKTALTEEILTKLRSELPFIIIDADGDTDVWEYRKMPEHLMPRSGFDPIDFGKYYYPKRFPEEFQPAFPKEEGPVRWVCGRYTLPGCFDNEDWKPGSYRRAYEAKKPLYFDTPAVPEEEAKPLNEVKVVFLGDGEAGKSHTIARLLNDGKQVKKFRGDSTPGIVIEDKLYKLGDREVKVHYWDFGGQEILHSMHRMFLTKRTLYVVLLNVREGNQDDRARYWLYNLRSFADGAPVLLVLNKMDMNKNASINEADLRKLYPGLTDVVKLSTLTYGDEKFQKEFVEVLTERIGKMDILEFPFIAAWSRLKEKLQNMEKNYIFGDEFRSYCDDAGVKGSDAVRRDLLEWFSDLGVSFCYSGEDSMNVEDHVVLRPDWITNAIYIILFNKVEAVNNGLVSHDTIYRMLSSEDTEKYRRTVAAAKYERDEVDYVLKVFRKFRLSFLVEDGMEFLPMLCDANSTAAAAEYENDPNALEFRMHYEYLPNNVIHRLMVDRRKELDRDNVWLTGARFVCGDTGRSAVVKSEGNLIRILVRAEKDPRDPQRYLDELKESLERINAIMGLTVSNTEVVYKEDGKSACFDYADLMFAQEIGETHIPCRELRKRIRLADVLMQSDFPEDEKQKKLMADIRQACEMLHEDSLYWKANEDQRTGLLAKLLRAKDYIAMEQHRTGISAGGIQSGELDLDIRLTPGDAWSALEALNLKGSSDSQIEYWNAHLKKLLDNYNDVGRSFLFHVSYVQCQKDKFGKICSDLYEHMRFYSPRGFELLRRFVSPVKLGTERDQNQFLRAVKCVYDCGGVTMTVYHFFVRIGDNT